MDMNGASVIVTGSSSGLGAAIALGLAAKGANLVINYSKSEDDARTVAAQCEAAGGRAVLCQANVADDGDCRRLAAAALDAWGRIDGLVNNAGTTRFARHDDLEALSAEDFQAVYAVNVIGPYQMIRAVTPAMKAQGAGAVVNVSSIAGVMGYGSSVAYAASKGALNIMTKSLARALGPEIRVNAICPGLIQGRWLREGMGDERYEAMVRSVEENTPLRRAGTAEDMAEAAIWLLEGARHVTGEAILVDAGMHLGPPRR
ncbi:MAG: SDR family oxidoreductase [Hyphomicrobiales bacterium]|nr:SDR family oxidoreductase [Hyphomicrobiales bacterium]MCP5372016.1 SDR family oxidoreductase [Hyphomicrobiales bacterium]